MEVNKEYESLAKFTADLSNLLQHNVVSVSGRLLEKGLVTKDVHDSMLTTEGVSGQKNAARLMSCVLDRVKCSSRSFHDFISVLREDTYFKDIVVKILEEHKSDSHAERDTVQNLQPPTDLKSIDSSLKNQESKQVGDEIKTLEKCFTDLKKRLLTEMKANTDVTTETLLESLTWNLPLELRTVYKPYLDEKLPTLEKLGTIREICSRLGLFFTFLDYHLLQYLVEEFGSDPLKQDMSAYAGKIQIFLDSTTVQQVKDHLPGQHKLPPNFDKLQMVIDQNPGTYSLRMLDNLRKRFCSETQLSEILFVLIGIGKANSFLVVLILPSVLGPRPVESIGQVDDSFYQRECIIAVSLNQRQLYLSVALREKKTELEERLLTLCIDNTGDIQEFRYILSQPGVDPNIYDQNGWTPLCNVAYDGRTEIAELLLDYGAIVDLPNKDELGATPLIAVSKEGHVSMCATLIQWGATVDYLNNEPCTALYIASQHGWKEVVELLLNSGASVDKPNGNIGATALRVASTCGHPEVVAVLLARGATVDYKDKEGMTPLFMASTKGHKEVAQLLLQNGALPDIPRNDGATPLFVASQNGHKEVAQLLLQNGAQPDIPRNDTSTPLMITSYVGHPDVCQLLIQHGSAVNYKMETGRTALAWAAYEGHKNVVDILLNAEANPDIQDEAGLTPLMLATQRGHKDVVQSLLESKANPNITDKTSGWTALHMACKEGHVEISRLLLEGGADVDVKDENQVTPFNLAKLHGNEEICDLLNNFYNTKTEKEVTEEQRDGVKKSYQRLLTILDALEEKLLPGRAEKRQRQKQSKERVANVTDSLNDTTLQV